MEALRYVAEVWEEEVWPPSSPNCNFFLYFVWGESEVCTVIRFGRVSAKFGTCTVVSVNGTLVEDIMRRFKG